MSLEAALAENTAVMKQLITVMQSATHGAEKQTKTKSTTAPASPAAGNTNDAAGNPIGTQYFDVPAHNTVYAVKPGEVAPNVAGAVAIADSQYLTKKAEYQGKVNAAVAAPAASAPAPTAAPATGAPSATPQPATASVAQPQAAEATFQDVVNKARELHGLGGNEWMKKLLDKHGAATLTPLNGKVPNAVLIADAQALIDEFNNAKAMGLI